MRYICSASLILLNYTCFVKEKGKHMKKTIQTIGLVLLGIVLLIVLAVGFLLVKNHIDAEKSWLAADYYTAFQSDAALEKKYAGLGAYAVANTVIPTDDDAIGSIRVWYPAEPEEKAKAYPLVLVTNASNTAACNYEAFFARLASWGFVVAGNDDRQAGTGASTAQTLDRLLALADDPAHLLYGKIRQTDIGAVGYSQGGAGAINAVTAFANSDRYKTLFTGSAAYALLAQNMGWAYDVSKINIPYFMTAGTGTSDDTGVADAQTEYGGVAPLSSLVANFESMTDDVCKVRARVVRAEHDEMQARTDGYMTAWLLYQLQGDTEAETVFVGADAEILHNANWQDVAKNR